MNWRTMSLTANGGATAVPENLSRANSANLAAILLISAEREALSCSLRRAKSLSCASVGRARREATALKSSEKVWDHSGFAGAEAELDSVCSDDFPVSETDDVVEEPRRVSKEILRSLSTSYRWLEVPFQDFGSPPCPEETELGSVRDESPLLRQEPESVVSSTLLSSLSRKHSAVNAVNHAYIHECQTGKSILSHGQLRIAMDSLGSWTAEAPRNCCTRYIHGRSDEVVTLAWPDLEAGGAEEIESFVSIVNRLEGKPVFFSRYRRLPFYPIGASRLSKTKSAMTSLVSNLSDQFNVEYNDTFLLL